jgi:hypothetical protein
MEEGLIIGDNDSSYNMDCEISEGSRLKILTGAFSYKNINSSAWSMLGDTSKLIIKSGARLKLHQTLESSVGMVVFRNSSILSRASGAQLLTPIHIGGNVSYEVCYN